jgi:CelD/BcsL family acetyltransferase involved in cellulose biosynthesis
MAAETGAWRVRVHHDWHEAAELWRPLLALNQATPFQAEAWLSRWYGEIASAKGAEPLLVHVTDADGVPALALPLIRLPGRLRSIEFADLGITDYNAPLLGPAAPRDSASAKRLWAAIRAALPSADLFRADKLPLTIDGSFNPLLLALGGRESNLFGNIIRIDTDWDGWLRGLEKHNRKELGRFWRVFTRDERARFVIAGNRDEALSLYRLLETQQAERMRELGQPYFLDQPEFSAFYRDLVLAGIEDGSAFLSALTAGDELVAGLIGIARGDHYAMVRISTGTGEWANCSPGRLVIERTMEALFRRGFRSFDLTIGDYAYKRGFEVARIPLAMVEERLSWRAWPKVGYSSAKAYVKRHPAIARLVRRAFRRAA